MASASASHNRQAARGDRRMFAASDDSTMLTQIQETNAPDDRDVDVKPILEIIKDVFKRATTSIDEWANIDSSMEGNTSSEAVPDTNGMLEELAVIIHKVFREITCKCSRGGDVHATTMTLLNTLSSYGWDAKVAIALGALARAYGEFGLVVQPFPTNPLAKSVALLKQLPDLMEQHSALKPWFEELNKLIIAMLDVTNSIIEFKQLPPQYISSEQPPLSVANTLIHKAAYWTISSVVACASQIDNLIGMSYEYTISRTDMFKLSSFYNKERNIRDQLNQQLNLCKQHIEKKKYNNLVREFESPHDNIRILRHLICMEDDKKPLFHGSTNSRVHVKELRRKTVLLYISDLEVSVEELDKMDQIYSEPRSGPESQYEIVWIPVIDKSVPWTEADRQRFQELQSRMPWHTPYDPIVLESAGITYIKKVWKFTKKSILVVLDPQGKVACQNALNMYLICGNRAFPFTAMDEEALWNGETWGLELFFNNNNMEPKINEWISEGKYICVYGGENLERIREFTKKAKEVAHEAGIDLEIIYVGKSNATEKTEEITTTIKDEGLSDTITAMENFWVRLKYVHSFKSQHGKNEENDPIMNEVTKVLSFDGSDQVWATMWFGSIVMTGAKEDALLNSLNNFNEWENKAKHTGFIIALWEHLKENQESRSLGTIIVSDHDGRILKRVTCAECGNPMDRCYMYRSCYD